jgi:hypothetical protein
LQGNDLATLSKRVYARFVFYHGGSFAGVKGSVKGIDSAETPPSFEKITKHSKSASSEETFRID